jgi:hypothetical protein
MPGQQFAAGQSPETLFFDALKTQLALTSV